MLKACQDFSGTCESYLLTEQRSKNQQRITKDALHNLDVLYDRLIQDIGESFAT